MPMGNLARDKAASGIEGSYYLSLHSSSAPRDSNEISGNSYARQAITMGKVEGGSSVHNHVRNTSSAIQITASGNWGNVAGFRIVRSQTGNMDEGSYDVENVLFSGPCVTQAVNNGDTFRVATGAIDLYWG